MYKKIVKIVSGIIITGIFLLFVLSFFDNRQKVTDIAKYEKYLGAEGKYKEHFNTYNDIFPDAIPQNAEVSDFIYYLASRKFSLIFKPFFLPLQQWFFIIEKLS